ncbi:MAG: hypothetical protein IJA78_03430 [Clostridia bacterium]|nr:hypothetical protein [Clostridia bacterium]
MKKRILCLLLALVLCASLFACKKQEPTDPPIGATPGSPDQIPESELDPERYLAEHGYPQGFALTFSYGREGERGKGFETAASRVYDGILSYPHDYSALLETLHNEMLTAKVYEIHALHADMTGFALSGGTLTAPLDNITYAITFTTSEGTYAILTDTLALETYSENPHISSLNVLITSFRSLTEQHLAAATA